jgi:hypothetical protein
MSAVATTGNGWSLSQHPDRKLHLPYYESYERDFMNPLLWLVQQIPGVIIVTMTNSWASFQLLPTSLTFLRYDRCPTSSGFASSLS